jgi:hypothetical protein
LEIKSRAAKYLDWADNFISNQFKYQKFAS